LTLSVPTSWKPEVRRTLLLDAAVHFGPDAQLSTPRSVCQESGKQSQKDIPGIPVTWHLLSPQESDIRLEDFCIGSEARVLEHRKQIRCKKVFAVPGNHTKEARKLTEEFTWLGNLAEISVKGQPIVLRHPMRVWNRAHHGAWHLYGHSHGKLPEAPTTLSMDVGVDTHDFRPWHFDEIDLLMTEKAKRLSQLRGTDPLNIQ
jgi:calcineurin-like phosphoesterase family protein